MFTIDLNTRRLAPESASSSTRFPNGSRRWRTIRIEAWPPRSKTKGALPSRTSVLRAPLGQSLPQSRRLFARQATVRAGSRSGLEACAFKQECFLARLGGQEVSKALLSGRASRSDPGSKCRRCRGRRGSPSAWLRPATCIRHAWSSRSTWHLGSDTPSCSYWPRPSPGRRLQRVRWARPRFDLQPPSSPASGLAVSWKPRVAVLAPFRLLRVFGPKRFRTSPSHPCDRHMRPFFPWLSNRCRPCTCPCLRRARRLEQLQTNRWRTRGRPQGWNREVPSLRDFQANGSTPYREACAKKVGQQEIAHSTC